MRGSMSSPGTGGHDKEQHRFWLVSVFFFLSFFLFLIKGLVLVLGGRSDRIRMGGGGSGFQAPAQERTG